MKKTRRFLLALLPVAVALIFASCGSSDEVAEPTPADGGTKTIPVKITVGMDDATRATVGSDNSTLYFHTADKLAVLSGGSCIALLENTTIAEGSSSATFQGNMTVPSDVSSYGEVTVVLIGSENVGVQTTNYSWANNGPAICVANGSSSALNEAVKKYSYLTGTGTFNPAGENNYTLTQHTAFLNVAVTFKDGTAADENLSVTVTNNSSTIGTGSVTTEADATSNDVVAKFVVPVAAGTTMNGATITLGSKDPITLSSTATLAGKSYKIEKTISGVEAVDLGLPSGTKWANMNVGATSPEGYGDYFAWGETTGYTSVYADPMTDHTFDWANYSFVQSGQSDWKYINKYTYDDGQTSAIWYDNGTFVGDGKTVLDTADDAAAANWGSAWKMPTHAQLQELVDNTVSELGQLNGVNGYYFYKKDGSGNKVANTYIFLPAAGYRADTRLINQGLSSTYWASELGMYYSSYSGAAWTLYFSNQGYVRADDKNHRYYGQSVRPVLAQ